MFLSNKDASFFSIFAQRKKIFFLFLTFLSGIYILYHYQDFQFFLSQGDHGRELYAYKKTLEGSLPYRDFSWLFGPFMPYYYSFFYFFFGAKIQSVLLGQNLLILLVGIFLFATCSTFMPISLSYICALWYWAYRGKEFVYSYQHVGAILMIIITIYFLMQYIQKRNLLSMLGGHMSTLLLLLIRPNMGLAILFGLSISLIMIETFLNHKKSFSKIILFNLSLALATILSTILIYGALLYGLPSHIIHQSFPFSQEYRAELTIPLLQTSSLIGSLLIKAFSLSWQRKIMGMVIISSFCYFLTLLFSKRFSPNEKRTILLPTGIFFLFLLLSLHEFVLSGIPYRLAWCTPIFFLLIFSLIALPITHCHHKLLPPFIKIFILIFLLIPSLLKLNTQIINVNRGKTSEHLLIAGENRVYTSQDHKWFKTVKQTLSFIKKNIPAQDRILTLPHDSLYLFLSGHDSATRQLDFFRHSHIPLEQEERIISDLIKNDIKWVIVSNRTSAKEHGMGTFGVTHCLKLSEFLIQNFELAAQFGDWKAPGGWIRNHNIRVLSRKK